VARWWYRSPDSIAEKQMEDKPVEKQAEEGHRSEMGEKIAVGNVGVGTNEHVLRISRDGRHTADIGRGCDG
jgi:hypothetical protein